MNRRRFIFALAALPIAVKFEGLFPAPLKPSMKYNTYILGKDAVTTIALEDVSWAIQHMKMAEIKGGYLGIAHPKAFADMMADLT